MDSNPHNTAANLAPPSSKIRQWIYSPKCRSVVFQLGTVALIVYVLLTIVANTLTNLESRGIATGFDFLHQTAGFGISFSLIDYNETDSYGRTFFVGLLNTALVSILGILFATLIGFIMGVARLSSNWLINRCAALYIEIFRNLPLLLQILFWYVAVLQTLPSARQSYHLGDAVFLNVRGLYLPAPIFADGSGWVMASLVVGIIVTLGIMLWAKRHFYQTGQAYAIWPFAVGLIIVVPTLVFWITGAPISADYPELKGFNFRGGLSVLPELVALWFALSIYTAAFIAEIVRSGINAVDAGQNEAAISLGLSKAKTLRLVIIPQAMRIIIPPLTSQYLNLTKNSSLATAIGYPDLVAVFAGTTMNQTGQAIEIIAMTMGVYLTLSIITSLLMNVYNKKMALVER